MTTDTLTPADVTEMDRLQDVLRSSPDGLCEMMLGSLGLASPDETLRLLRTVREMEIESSRCVGLGHEPGTGIHRRLRWYWKGSPYQQALRGLR